MSLRSAPSVHGDAELSMVMMDRRRFLRQTLALSIALPMFSGLAALPAAPRWVILNWGLTEMALALGIVPVGIAAPVWYRRLYRAPQLPATVADVGLLYQPNYETLRELRPTLLLVTPAHQMADAQLMSIAPLLVLNTDSRQPLEQSEKNMRQMAMAAGRSQVAERVIADAQARLESARLAARPYRDTPLYLASVVDLLHLRLFSQGCLFDDVLRVLGLTNASQLPASPQGSTLISLDQLVTRDTGRVVLIPSYPQNNFTPQLSSRLWQSLPLLQKQNLLILPQGLPENGGLLTAVGFAESLVLTLQQQHPGGVNG